MLPGELYYSSSLYAKHLSVSLERFRASSTHIGQPELTWQYPLSEFWVLFQTNKDCLGKSISPLLQASMAACMITVDQESFTLRTIRVKNFVLFKFSWFRLICDIFFNSWWLQYGRAPGEFLVFSLLPGIRRARDHWLWSSIGHLPWGVWTCTQAYSVIITA